MLLLLQVITARCQMTVVYAYLS